jgi:subtilase family serine protease
MSIRRELGSKGEDLFEILIKTGGWGNIRYEDNNNNVLSEFIGLNDFRPKAEIIMTEQSSLNN